MCKRNHWFLGANPKRSGSLVMIYCDKHGAILATSKDLIRILFILKVLRGKQY